MLYKEIFLDEHLWEQSVVGVLFIVPHTEKHKPHFLPATLAYIKISFSPKFMVQDPHFTFPQLSLPEHVVVTL